MFVILGLRFYRNGQWNTDLNWLFLLLLQTVNATFPVQLCYSKNKKHDLKWILLLLRSSTGKIDKNDAKGIF